MIAAISEEHGLIDYVVHPKAIKTEVVIFAFINLITDKLVGEELKATYKKLLLKCVINDAPHDTMGLIKQSLRIQTSSELICFGIRFYADK